MVEAKEMLISPKRAKEFLERNTNNRPLSKTYVAQLAAVMARDEWQSNGETIKITKAGIVVDGQHRLHAIIESGKSLRILVAEGVDNDSFGSIDTGKRRSAADTLAVMGVKDYAVVSAAVRLVLMLAEGAPTFRETFTNEQIKEWVEVYADELGEFMPLAREVYRTQLVNKSTVVGLSYYMKQKDNRLIDTFWHRVADGVGLNQGHPILALRKRLIDHRIGTAKLPQRDIVALVIKAWNKTRKNEMLHPRAGLAWREDEPFPRVS